jgi:anti-sigma B factor antagonist
MNEDKFNVINTPEGSIEKLAIQGYLDAQTAPVLEEAIQSVVDEEKYNILINFNDLEYISSAGLGVFMSFIEQVREKGGDIKMAEMSDNVYNVFDLLGFPMLFDIDKSETEVIEKFNKKQVPQNDF